MTITVTNPVINISAPRRFGPGLSLFGHSSLTVTTADTLEVILTRNSDHYNVCAAAGNVVFAVGSTFQIRIYVVNGNEATADATLCDLEVDLFHPGSGTPFDQLLVTGAYLYDHVFGIPNILADYQHTATNPNPQLDALFTKHYKNQP